MKKLVLYMYELGFKRESDPLVLLYVSEEFSSFSPMTVSGFFVHPSHGKARTQTLHTNTWTILESTNRGECRTA